MYSSHYVQDNLYLTMHVTFTAMVGYTKGSSTLGYCCEVDCYANSRRVSYPGWLFQ